MFEEVASGSQREMLPEIKRRTGPLQYRRVRREVLKGTVTELTVFLDGGVLVKHGEDESKMRHYRRSAYRQPRGRGLLVMFMLNLVVMAATGGAVTVAILLAGLGVVLAEAWPCRIRRERRPISHRLMAAVPWMGLDAIWDHEHDEWWL